MSVELGQVLSSAAWDVLYIRWRDAMCDCSNVSVVTASRVVSAAVYVRCDEELC